MRTLSELSTSGSLSVVGQEVIARKAASTRWVVDDRGRVAVLTSHPVALWASEFDQPIKAILELGFICIEDRPKKLILALNTSRVQRVTLVGAFYYLAHHDANRIIICSDCGSESAYYTIVDNVKTIYTLLEDMITSAHPDIPSIANRLESKMGKRSTRYTRFRSPMASMCRLRTAEAEQLLPA